MGIKKLSKFYDSYDRLESWSIFAKSLPFLTDNFSIFKSSASSCSAKNPDLKIKEQFIGKNIISIEDFSKNEIDFILEISDDIKKNPEKYKNLLDGKIMAPLFFEPSTRTSASFQSAMLKLGGKVLDFDVYSSSVLKGETLRDTLKIIQGYFPDYAIIRHKKDGSARFAADVLNIPVINAGDGQNQHPTQTLLDLFTIKEIFGKIDSVKVAIAGDLKYGRTVHSLSLALARYNNCDIKFISPDSLKMPKEFLVKLDEKGCKYSEYLLDDFKKIIEECDILYMTRVQRERFPEGFEGEQEYEKVSNEYKLTKDMLEGVKQGFKIMHPLPKVFEIEDEIDNMEYSYYFKQAENGLYVRQALLLLIGGLV